MKRVTGIGGIFFKAQDAEKLRAWYQQHLGIQIESYGGAAFQWRNAENPDGNGYTAWSIFHDSTTYLEPSKKDFMINYRVADLTALLEQLRVEGVWIDEKREEGEYGCFAWIMDPEGNRIELWEPPPGS
jgi:predicted enzyme related to lactoylglutathione lyase